MFHNKVNKVMGILICVLAISLGVFSSLYYQELKEDERKRELFINHLYFSIDSSLYNIDNIMEAKDGNERESYIRILEKTLLEADAILRYGNMFINKDLYRSDFFRHASNFLYGVNLTGTVNAQVPPIGENNQLTESDLKLLYTIKGYLENAREEMYSEQTKQENPNLTIVELNEIILIHLNNYHHEIYKDAFR